MEDGEEEGEEDEEEGEEEKLMMMSMASDIVDTGDGAKPGPAVWVRISGVSAAASSSKDVGCKWRSANDI